MATPAASQPAAPTGPSKVLVLGANGRFGAAVVLAFAAAGWQVVAQLRRPPRQAWPRGIVQVQDDRLDPTVLLPAAAGATVVVNALNPDYTRWAEQWPPLNRAVVALAERLGATLVLPGNVYNYGRQLPPLLREDTPMHPDHDKAVQRVALEATMAEAAADGRLRSLVLRAGDYLGDTGTWVDLGLGRALPRGRFLQMGPVDLPHAWAWLPDLARCVVALAERRHALPDHAVLHHAGLGLTGAEFEAAFDAAWQARGGAPLHRGRFPWWALQAAAWLPGRAGAMPRAVLEMRHLWQRPHRLDGSRLSALLGSALPATPLPQVMAGCIDALPPALRVGLKPALQEAPGRPEFP